MIHGYEVAKHKDGSTGTTSYAGAQVATMINGKPEWTALGTFEQMRGTGQHGECSGKRYMDSQTHIGDRICHGLGGHNDRRRQQTVRVSPRSVHPPIALQNFKNGAFSVFSAKRAIKR